MTAAIISAIAAILGGSLVVFFTKQKEREAEWRSRKLAYYEEFSLPLRELSERRHRLMQR